MFGQNAWMPDTIGSASACANPPCVLYGKLHKNWQNIQSSYASIIRFGGISPDKNRPTNYQYIKMIDSVRARGMEPILQVPYHNGQYTAQQAAAIVQFVNITKGKNIKYWIIGNEPDLGYSYTTAAQVASYFKPFASAMKAVDPTILTIGPETAWYDQGIINGLTTPGGPDDITGRDANGRLYCDFISFHYYAFNGTQTRAQVLTKLMMTGGLNDNLVLLNARLANCNAYHNRTGTSMLRSAITEANINYQNSSTDNLNGVGSNSFIGGQFIAEMFSVAMKNSVNFVTVWSVMEGNSTALNIGYLDPATGTKKPMFWHYKMMAEVFKGNYAGGNTNNSNVKAFGSKDANSINVMILNQDAVSNYAFTLRLNTGTVSGTNPLKMNINAGVNAEYNDNITNQTSVLLTFNLQGQLIKKCVYSLANHAAPNLPPSCQTVNSVLPITLVDFNSTLINKSQVLLKWQTASEESNQFFIVQRSKDAFEFEDLTWVNGAGTTKQNNSYQFVDEQPGTGTIYYRLKQVDYDQSVNYSKVTSVTVTAEDVSVLVFPNPCDGNRFSVKVNGSTDHPQIELYNLNGQKLKTEVVADKDGFTGVPENKLSPGPYVIKTTVGTTAFISKLIVN